MWKAYRILDIGTLLILSSVFGKILCFNSEWHQINLPVDCDFYSVYEKRPIRENGFNQWIKTKPKPKVLTICFHSVNHDFSHQFEILEYRSLASHLYIQLKFRWEIKIKCQSYWFSHSILNWCIWAALFLPYFLVFLCLSFILLIRQI